MLAYRFREDGGVLGAFIGALLGLPTLSLGSLGIAPLLVFIVSGGIGGATLRLWFGDGRLKDCYRLEDALKRGETVMMLEIDHKQFGKVESKVKFRHPEVSVLDTDAG